MDWHSIFRGCRKAPKSQIQKERRSATLLSLKDHLRISDNNWSCVCKSFQLSEKCTLWHIKNLREEWDLKNQPPKDPQTPILVKFAFDGATMTSWI